MRFASCLHILLRHTHFQNPSAVAIGDSAELLGKRKRVQRSERVPCAMAHPLGRSRVRQGPKGQKGPKRAKGGHRGAREMESRRAGGRRAGGGRRGRAQRGIGRGRGGQDSYGAKGRGLAAELLEPHPIPLCDPCPDRGRSWRARRPNVARRGRCSFLTTSGFPRRFRSWMRRRGRRSVALRSAVARRRRWPLRRPSLASCLLWRGRSRALPLRTRPVSVWCATSALLPLKTV